MNENNKRDVPQILSCVLFVQNFLICLVELIFIIAHNERVTTITVVIFFVVILCVFRFLIIQSKVALNFVLKQVISPRYSPLSALPIAG